MSEWLVRRGNRPPIGPFSASFIHRGLSSGKLPVDSEACRVGETVWRPVSSVVDQQQPRDDEDDAPTGIVAAPWFRGPADTLPGELHDELEEEATRILNSPSGDDEDATRVMSGPFAAAAALKPPAVQRPRPTAPALRSRPATSPTAGRAPPRPPERSLPPARPPLPASAPTAPSLNDGGVPLLFDADEDEVAAVRQMPAQVQDSVRAVAAAPGTSGRPAERAGSAQAAGSIIVSPSPEPTAQRRAINRFAPPPDPWLRALLALIVVLAVALAAALVMLSRR